MEKTRKQGGKKQAAGLSAVISYLAGGTGWMYEPCWSGISRPLKQTKGGNCDGNLHKLVTIRCSIRQRLREKRNHHDKK